MNARASLKLLVTIVAYDRHDLANRRLTPTADALAGPGHQGLQTEHGPLDLLGQLDELGYDELLPRAIAVKDGTRAVRVLDRPTLIEVKTREA